MVALILGEHALGGVRFVAFIQRRDERGPASQHRGDRQYLLLGGEGVDWSVIGW